MKKVVLIVFLSSLAFPSWAQRTCATTEINQLNKSKEQQLLEQQAFEEWLVQKRALLVQQNALQDLSETIIYTIPVVVHVIHNGEPEGEGFNITNEQIAAQIEVLNRDFRHLNADSVNTPVIFQPLMADIGFEFELAKRDTIGLPTNGITRTNGNKTDWSINDNSLLKSLSYWSSDDYLNIWVAPLASPQLGWAEFPTSNIIDGVNNVAQNNPLTDGVVINTKAFGSAELYLPGNYLADFDLGRTATHEIGHFFGLRHISGDGGCDVDDFVVDTPKTKDYYFNCPAAGTFTNSCEAEPSMFMNYMDLVDDDCMNLFSLEQKDRMVIIINNSPRRASLLTSMALEPPPPLDIAITAMPSPGIGTCDYNIFPTVTIQNTGMALVTEVELSISVNNVEMVQQTFSVSLNPNQDTTLAMPDFFLSQHGNLNFTAIILSTNGLQDDLSGNNTFNKQTFLSGIVTTLEEDFTNWPQSWAVRTEAPVSQWNFSQAPNVQIENTAAVLSYYQNNSPFLDQLISPVLDLSAYSNPYLLFDHAYGEIGNHNDALAVLVSFDCGNTFQDTLFLKSGNELATTEIPIKFTPSGPIDWQTTLLYLSNYSSQLIQLAFVGNSDGGNNIYLDNFLLVDSGYEDVSLKGLVNESGAFNSTINTIGLVVENTGTTTVSTLEIEITEDSNVTSSQTFSNMNLLPGRRGVVHLDNKFTVGSHQLSFKLLLNDAISDNNQLLSESNFLASSEFIPFREKFNFETWNERNNWSIASPNDNISWQYWSLSNDFIYYPAFTQGNTGLHDWLVLPLFDFSKTSAASLQYKIAYASNDNNNEAVRIWVSTNNGYSFDYLVQSLSGIQMSTHISTAEWSPLTAEDWATQYLDLSEFAGEDNVLIAFEAIDGDGNNIYLDDIELFVSNEPNMIEVPTDNLAIYPNPISDLEAQISFNLSEKQDVVVRIIDIRGNVISNQQFVNVLNQTFPLELSTQRNGIYIIQAIGPGFTNVTRVLVNN